MTNENHSPQEILKEHYEIAHSKSHKEFLSYLPQGLSLYLRMILENAETQKGVLGVTLTSIVYKIFRPQQDIRYHQDQMQNGYSGRSFDTKIVTPFLQKTFPHYAMAESAWLTRSLEQL
jgi:DNA (cytosine-5)-methyltransferase 1